MVVRGSGTAVSPLMPDWRAQSWSSTRDCGCLGGRRCDVTVWSRMQVELLDRHRWRTRIELANAIFEYLEVFHDRQRRHSTLGMLSPIEFEARQPTTVA